MMQKHSKEQPYLSLREEKEVIDVQTVSVEQTLPPAQRIPDFLAKIKNPYCFQTQGTIVQVRFQESGRNLQQAVTELLREHLQ